MVFADTAAGSPLQSDYDTSDDMTDNSGVGLREEEVVRSVSFYILFLMNQRVASFRAYCPCPEG